MAALARTILEHLFFFSSCAFFLPPLCCFTFSPSWSTSAHTPLSERDAKKNKVQSWPMQHRRIWLHPAVVSDSGCLISTPNHSKGTGSDSLNSKPSWQRRPC